MSTHCSHNYHALCKDCKELKPYWIFKFNLDCNKVGDEDKCCGYFYANGCSKSELVGKKVITTTKEI